MDKDWPYPESEMEERREAFAFAYLRNPDNPSAAAREIEKHPGRAYWIFQNWAFDETVLALMGKTVAELGPKATIPTKEEFASKLFRDANEIGDPEIRLDYMELFAKVMGYVEKPGTIVNNNVLTSNRVLLMPSSASSEEWEAKLKAQQTRLIDAAAEN